MEQISHDPYYHTFSAELDRRLARVARSAKTVWHGIFWKFLWSFALARPYSNFMCRMGWYRQYQEGRCGWCGEAIRSSSEQA